MSSNNDSMMTYLVLGALIGYVFATKMQKLGADSDLVVSPSYGAAPKATTAKTVPKLPTIPGTPGAPKFAPAPAPGSAARGRGAAKAPAAAIKPLVKPTVPTPPKPAMQPTSKPTAAPKPLKAASGWYGAGANNFPMPEITVFDDTARPVQPGLR